MKTDFATRLRCPAGHHPEAALTLSHQEEGAFPKGPKEIRRGRLTCRVCSAAFHVENGIAYLLPNPTQEIEKEREGIAKVYEGAMSENYDSTLLSQPWIHDSENPGHWESIAANFQQALDWLSACDAGADKSGMFLLDLGAGSTWSTVALCRAGYTCAALDISTHPKAGLGAADIRMAAGAPLFDRVVGDMGRLPFQDGSVDRVTSIDSIHHAADLGEALREVFRVLRPGGVLLSVAEPVRGVLRNRNHGHREIQEFGWNEHAYTRKGYVRAAQAAGFDARVLFPASIEARLTSASASALGRKLSNRILGSVARAAWKVGPVKDSLTGPLFGPLQSALGLPMTLVGVKPTSGTSAASV